MKQKMVLSKITLHLALLPVLLFLCDCLIHRYRLLDCTDVGPVSDAVTCVASIYQINMIHSLGLLC